VVIASYNPHRRLLPTDSFGPPNRSIPATRTEPSLLSNQGSLFEPGSFSWGLLPFPPLSNSSHHLRPNKRLRYALRNYWTSKQQIGNHFLHLSIPSSTARLLMYHSCIPCAASGSLRRPACSIRSLHPCSEPREVRRAFMHLPVTLLALSFQSLPTIKLNYPTRIVHPERSEGSLFEREVSAAHPNPFRLFSFQQLTTVKFSNHFVLKTIQNARGVWRHSRSNDLKRYPNPRITSVSPLECAVTRFRVLSPLECAVPKTPSCKSFRMRSSKKRWGVPIGSQFPTNPAFLALRFSLPSSLRCFFRPFHL